MINHSSLQLKPLDDVQVIKGITFPSGIKYRQLIVTGPPGSGKSRIIREMGGWPEEGFIDLTLKNWWRAQSLTYRPREVHMGFPFVGYDDCLTVFDQAFSDSEEILELELSRIILPPLKTTFFSVDWRERYVFEFLVPPPENIMEWRLERSKHEVHPIDEGVTLNQIKRQISVYLEAAQYFSQSGLLMYVRENLGDVPKIILDPASGDGTPEANNLQKRDP
ncbi:MAG: hypothetical protein ACR2OW_01020 [Methyloligellaceae bacterium]